MVRILNANIFVFTLALGNLYASYVFAEDVNTLRERTHQSEKLLVQYPKIQDQYERDFDQYFLDLLTLALDKSGVSYTLEPLPLPLMVESRSAKFLESNQNMVHWLNASVEREHDLRPIKVPLFKGLIGWRLLFIRKEEQPEFFKIMTKSDLANYVAGQGHDWPDIKILKENNLKVLASSSWQGLFEMLTYKRIDYFPRSVIEIERELRIFSSLDLYVEKSLVLRYPAAYYFFVNTENQSLATAIEAGLKKAIADGEFDTLFNRNFADIIKRAQLDERKIIELKSSGDFPLNDEPLWYRP